MRITCSPFSDASFCQLTFFHFDFAICLQRDGSFWSEGIYGLGCGLAYGMTSAVVGQPLDSVKTKMQAQAVYKNMSMFKTFGHVIKTEGVIGLYRGILPPLVGSSIFRSVQFGAYNFAWAGLGQNFPSTLSHIPGTELESRVILGSIFASGIRSVIECPLELIKVRQMTGQPWTVSQLFSGFNVLFFRTCGLLATFFIGVDYATRYIPDLITTPYIGPFIKGFFLFFISRHPIKCML
jgi:hypothetical protein